ncbi:MAG: ArsR family transcriptional regulator [Gammaproteobacteria bacterium]|nr:MAG: ArsR family transcriptional regulator [Gammaproteobacteria bacterium]
MTAEHQLQAIAALNKSSSDPLRLRILRALSTDSFGVLELCDIFSAKQSGMSHHLKVLAKAGVVTTRREGNSIFYRRSLGNEHLPQGQLLASLFQVIDQLPLDDTVQARIQQVKQQRAEVARAFFNKHAEAFRAKQDLIATFDQYAESARDLLLKAQPQPSDQLLEIGSGSGEFLTLIHQHFKSITALDISEEMLEQAQQLSQQQKLNNIKFLLGDTQTAIKAHAQPNHIVCNMVLHHVPSPADVFIDSAALLKSGGSMVVTDLCHHDQAWAKENCGDLWLGFESEDLTRWANAAGLEENESLYLGLRNGFQIQIHRYEKPNTVLKSHVIN